MFERSEEFQKYCKEWQLFMEKYHDLKLEKEINENKIDIYVHEFKWSEKRDNNFEHTYFDDDSFDCHFSCRSSLRYLFMNDFKWINITSKSKYYKLFFDLKTGISRSPYKNFENNHDLFVLIKNKKIYCILGVAVLPKKVNKTFFDYIGELYKNTNKQTSIFDFIDEKW